MGVRSAAGCGGGWSWSPVGESQLLLFAMRLEDQSAPFMGASSSSVTLLLLVVGASTGATAAAVVVGVRGSLELGVGSGWAGGCFFFLRRLKRLRRPLLTWAKASRAMGEKSYLAAGR